MLPRDLRRESEPRWPETELDLEALWLAIDVHGWGSRVAQAARRSYVERSIQHVGQVIDSWRAGHFDDEPIEHVIGWLDAYASAGARETLQGSIDL